MDPGKPERWFERHASRWGAILVALLLLFLLMPLGAWLADCAYPSSPAVHRVAEAMYSNGAIVAGGLFFVAVLWLCFGLPRRA